MPGAGGSRTGTGALPVSLAGMVVSQVVPELYVTKKLEPLSTDFGQKRYQYNACSTIGSAALRLAGSALLFVLLTLVAVPRLHAEEEPLPSEFLDYLGSVENLGIRGMELLDLDEINGLLQKLLRDVSAANKKSGNEKGKGKDGAHDDAAEK